MYIYQVESNEKQKDEKGKDKEREKEKEEGSTLKCIDYIIVRTDY